MAWLIVVAGGWIAGCAIIVSAKLVSRRNRRLAVRLVYSGIAVFAIAGLYGLWAALRG